MFMNDIVSLKGSLMINILRMDREERHNRNRLGLPALTVCTMIGRIRAMTNTTRNTMAEIDMGAMIRESSQTTTPGVQDIHRITIQTAHVGRQSTETMVLTTTDPTREMIDTIRNTTTTMIITRDPDLGAGHRHLDW